MNDINETGFHPGEADIHAYVDGRLNASDGARMEAWLDRHPERAEEIRAWRRDAQQLRAEGGDLPTAIHSPSLDPVAIRGRRRQRLHARLAVAAALVLAVGVGGIGGWQAHDMSAPTASAPMADAMQAYRMYAMNRHARLDVIQHHAGDLQTWLDRHFRHAARLPNLSGSGFHPVGGRLVATDSGPAAMVLYENGQGSAISFYVRSPSARTGTLPRGQRRDGQLAATYWSGHGYNYALVSRVDAAGMHAIREASLSSST